MHQSSHGAQPHGHNPSNDPYIPDWQDATIYAKSARVGYYDQLDHRVCHYNNEKIQKRQIPLCDTSKSLQFLGFGFPLFYMFIRNCILLLTLMIFVSNVFTIVDAVQQHDCSQSTKLLRKDRKDYFDQKCNNVFILWANIKPSAYSATYRIAEFLAHLLCLFYIKEKIVDTWKYYDERESDLSDYSIMVNVGSDNLHNIRQRINDCIKKQVFNQNGRPLNIHQVVLIPPANTLYNLEHDHQHAIEHYLHGKYGDHSEHHQGHGGHDSDHALHEIKEIEEKIEREVRLAKAGLANDSLACENAIVIFETQPEKEWFLKEVDNKQDQIKKYFNYPEQPVEFFEAPEPRQIIYHNLQEQDSLVKNVFISWALSVGFLTLTVLVFYFLQLGKNAMLEAIQQSQLQGQHQGGHGGHGDKGGHGHKASLTSHLQEHHFVFPIYAYILSYGLLFLIILFNKFIMGAVLHHFTHMERHYNKAHEDFSFAAKYTMGMFLTTAFMTIIVQALQANNYYKDDFGLIVQETIMFVFSAVIIPLNWVINPYRLCHNCKRDKHYGKNDVTQHQANHLMAEYHYDMGKRYAQILQMMWFAFLYSDMIPVGGVFIVIGLCFYYWIDKYNLLRRASVQSNISADLVIRCLSLLDLTLFWKYIGEIVFDATIKGGVRTLSLIFLALSIIYFVIPWREIILYFKQDQFKLNQKTFTQEKARFSGQRYELFHPVYKHIKEEGLHKSQQNQGHNSSSHGAQGHPSAHISLTPPKYLGGYPQRQSQPQNHNQFVYGAHR